MIFVGVTGSAGKTTTKDLIAAVLARRYRGTRSPGTHNAAHWVPRTVLGVRPDDEFCVQELGASGPGTLDAAIALVRPRVAVITNVGGDHRKAFRTLDATATEKSKLVSALPPDGLAILNADDPRVLAMMGSGRGSVLTYGLTPDAAVHAESVRSSWPDRLTFVAIHGEQRVVVHTRFIGVHWAHACLAAIATGVGLGIPLAEAAAALADVEPWSGRLEPVEAGGVTFLRDECKASLWSIGPSLEVLRSARAPRKIAVIGTISDYGGRASAVYAAVARQALEAADEVVFVGPQAHRCGAARAHPRGASLHAFLTPARGAPLSLRDAPRRRPGAAQGLAARGPSAPPDTRAAGADGVLENRLPAHQVLRRVHPAPGAAASLGDAARADHAGEPADA